MSPRPEDGGWGDFTLLPKAERLPEPDRPHKCSCDPWPCVEATCLRCPACEKHGHALITRTEERWVETGKGLTEEEARAMRRLSGTHEGHNSRLLREALPADAGGDPPETVADACA